MCYLKPLRVKTIQGKEAILENGLRAYYEKKIGPLKSDDLVVVYGNLIIEKIIPKRYEKAE